MRILFDHNTPRPLRQYLLADKHTISLSRELEWQRKSNGDLISSAEAEGYDLIITTDQSIKYQQNLSNRKIAILLLMPANWKKLIPCVERIKEAVKKAGACPYQELRCSVKVDPPPSPPGGSASAPPPNDQPLLDATTHGAEKNPPSKN